MEVVETIRESLCPSADVVACRKRYLGLKERATNVALSDKMPQPGEDLQKAFPAFTPRVFLQQKVVAALSNMIEGILEDLAPSPQLICDQVELLADLEELLVLLDDQVMKLEKLIVAVA